VNEMLAITQGLVTRSVTGNGEAVPLHNQLKVFALKTGQVQVDD
jgi:hypothetical protein